jgi:hypothetical protein
MRRAAATRFAFALALSANVLCACRADESVLEAIFPCDLDGGDEQCGTDEDGRPMTCYVGSAQLGGQAFCTKSCDPEGEVPLGFVCTSSGALLETCNPDPEEGNTCQDPLQCYRTDVVFDEGICLWLPLCPYEDGSATELDNSQCPFSHQLCAGSLLRGLSSLPLRVNNLHCIADRCDQRLPCPTTTQPAEVCPTEFYNPPYQVPVTCAVRCDKYTCPPNYTCIASPSSGAPPVCLPGIIGMRCASSEDCLAGTCIDTGAGFSVCTSEGGCDNEVQCQLLGTNPPFACAEGIPGGGAYCVQTIPFHGSNCESDDQCAEELRCATGPCPRRKCARYSPFELNPSHGECRFECEDRCTAFGGLPHACLPDGSCYPGTFSVPCRELSDCVENLVCASVPADERSRGNDPKICTASCSTDSDCNGSVNPWLAAGYCVPSPEAAPETVGFCRLGASAGAPCEKPEHCAFRCCLPGVDGGVCGEEGSCPPEEP